MTRLLSILVLLTPLCLVAGPAGAGQIDIVLDVGPPGTLFGERTFQLPQLVGVPIEDELLSVDFSYGPGTFLDSTVFVAGNSLAEIELTFDPLLPTSVQAGPGIAGFATDELGIPIPSAGLFHSYGPSGAPDLSRLTLTLDRKAQQMITIRHFGMHAEWDFNAQTEAVGSVIRSAKITFLDGRRFFPTAPLPHRVGVLVPEPSLLGLVAIAVAGGLAARSGNRKAPRT